MKLPPHPPPPPQPPKNLCFILPFYTLKFTAYPFQIIVTDGWCSSKLLSGHQQRLCSANDKKGPSGGRGGNFNTSKMFPVSAKCWTRVWGQRVWELMSLRSEIHHSFKVQMKWKMSSEPFQITSPLILCNYLTILTQKNTFNLYKHSDISSY